MLIGGQDAPWLGGPHRLRQHQVMVHKPMAGGVSDVSPIARASALAAQPPITALELAWVTPRLKFFTPSTPSVFVEVAHEHWLGGFQMRLDLAPVLYRVEISHRTFSIHVRYVHAERATGFAA